MRGSLSIWRDLAVTKQFGMLSHIAALEEVRDMDTVKLTIDGKEIEVERGTTILEAARLAGVHIPTLCYHPALSGIGSCRVCVCEVEGAKSLVAACVCPANDGMVVWTNSPAVREARRTVLELLIASHPQDCLTCDRSETCELRRLASRLNVRGGRFTREKKALPKDTSSPSIVRDPSKCILCGRCVQVCSSIQGIGAIGLANRGIETIVAPAFGDDLANTKCVACGQCSAVCPVGAIVVKDDTDPVFDALGDPDKHVVVQVAPAVRAALGEEFGLPAGTDVTEQMVGALKQLGFDAVFDTQFSADLTIVEEGNELVERLKNGGPFPLITSCSPGWINYMENFHPSLAENVSSCKSPQQMMGAVIKTYYAKKVGIDPSKIVSVSVMPCTAKKFEAQRPEMNSSGYRDVDIVLTTRELADMLRQAGIDLKTAHPGSFDSPLGESTGAGEIFGVTGGVMEAALRSVYYMLTGKPLANFELQPVRGFSGIRESEIEIAGQWIRVAVAHGLSNAEELLRRILAKEKEYHFVEIMACPGGCIGGGGQPFSNDPEIKAKRASVLYAGDGAKRQRMSHENPWIKKLYEEFLGSPGSDLSHKLLHTTYCQGKAGLNREAV